MLHQETKNVFKNTPSPKKISKKGLCLLFFISLLPDLFILLGDPIALSQRGFLLEDAFYYLKLAQNLTEGLGFTLDGIHPTNGFHPLYLLSLLPGAFFLESWDFIRYALFCCSLFRALLGLVLFILVEKKTNRTVALFTFFLWTFAATPRMLLLNGMDTALFLLLFTLTLSTFLLKKETLLKTKKESCLLGFLLGLTYLARTDAIFLALPLGVDLFRKAKSRMAKRNLGVIVGIGLGTVLPWLLLSQLTIGSVFPESGAASRFLAKNLGNPFLNETIGPHFLPEAIKKNLGGHLLEGRTLIYSWLESWRWASPLSNLMGLTHSDFFKAPFDSFLFKRLEGSIIGLTLFLSFSGFLLFKLARKYQLTLFLFAPLLIWLFYGFLPGPPWFSIRYMAPLILTISLLLSIRIGEWFCHFPYQKRLIFISAICILFHDTIQYKNLFPNPTSPAGYVKEALWVKENLPQNAVIGSFQAGVMSFLSKRTVINLDGVVNNSALEALKSKKMIPYLLENNIDFIADARGLIHHFIERENPHLFQKLFLPLRKSFFTFYQLNPSLKEAIS